MRYPLISVHSGGKLHKIVGDLIERFGGAFRLTNWSRNNLAGFRESASFTLICFGHLIIVRDFHPLNRCLEMRNCIMGNVSKNLVPVLCQSQFCCWKWNRWCGTPSCIVFKELMSIGPLDKANSFFVTIQVHFPIIEIKPSWVQLILWHYIGHEVWNIGHIQKCYGLRTW